MTASNRNGLYEDLRLLIFRPASGAADTVDHLNSLHRVGLSVNRKLKSRREPISVPEIRLSAQLAKPKRRSRSTKASYADPTTLPANFACNVTSVIPAASSRGFVNANPTITRSCRFTILFRHAVCSVSEHMPNTACSVSIRDT